MKESEGKIVHSPNIKYFLEVLFDWCWSNRGIYIEILQHPPPFWGPQGFAKRNGGVASRETTPSKSLRCKLHHPSLHHPWPGQYHRDRASDSGPKGPIHFRVGGWVRWQRVVGWGGGRGPHQASASGKKSASSALAVRMTPRARIQYFGSGVPRAQTKPP